MRLNVTFAFFLLLGFALCSSSCNQNHPKEKAPENWDVKNTRIVESYDQINRLAIKNAQDSLGVFINVFNSKQNGDLEFYIKSKFADAKGIENMWSAVSSIEGDSLLATLNNVPLKLTTVKIDDKIKVAKKDIEDWAIYKGDSLLLGNFIVRNHE